MTLYVVTMYRFGNTESHSYLLGVYDELYEAVMNAKGERDYRGGKYEAQILRVELNQTKIRQLMYETPDFMSELPNHLMKCPKCGKSGYITQFETDDLYCKISILNKDYVHVCPACMYHFTKKEVQGHEH